jgi:hypothetical protein
MDTVIRQRRCGQDPCAGLPGPCGPPQRRTRSSEPDAVRAPLNRIVPKTRVAA